MLVEKGLVSRKSGVSAEFIQGDYQMHDIESPIHISHSCIHKSTPLDLEK